MEIFSEIWVIPAKLQIAGITHILRRISRCFLQLWELNYSLHIVQQDKYSNSKIKNIDFKKSKKMTTNPLTLSPFIGFHDEKSTFSFIQILKLHAEKKDMHGFELKFDVGKQKEKIVHLV